MRGYFADGGEASSVRAGCLQRCLLNGTVDLLAPNGALKNHADEKTPFKKGFIRVSRGIIEPEDSSETGLRDFNIGDSAGDNVLQATANALCCALRAAEETSKLLGYLFVFHVVPLQVVH
jgi:hypothetical protein